MLGQQFDEMLPLCWRKFMMKVGIIIKHRHSCFAKKFCPPGLLQALDSNAWRSPGGQKFAKQQVSVLYYIPTFIISCVGVVTWILKTARLNTNHTTASLTRSRSIVHTLSKATCAELNTLVTHLQLLPAINRNWTKYEAYILSQTW